MGNLPIFKIVFDPEMFESGINAIALTETPAIEVLALRFSKENKEYTFSIDSEKRLVVGPAIIPDKPIYRREGNKEFYVVFTQEVIDQMLEKFQKEYREIKFNLEHDSDKPVSGFIKEAWVVEDSEKDKSSLYGFNLPVGTLMLSAKIEDDEQWETIKSLENVGFSIEGLMGISAFSAVINKNKNEKSMKKKKFISTRTRTIKKFNKTLKKFEEELETVNDEILIVEDLEKGKSAEILNDNGEVVVAEDGLYEIPSEEVVIEVTDGVISEVASTEEDAPAIEDAPAEDAPAEEDTVDETKATVDELISKIAALESRLEALEASVKEEEAQETQMSHQFSATSAERLSFLKNYLSK